MELSSPSFVSVGSTSQPAPVSAMTKLESLSLSNGGDKSHESSSTSYNQRVDLSLETHLNVVSQGSAGTPLNYSWVIYPNKGENSAEGSVTGSGSTSTNGSSSSLIVDRPLIYGNDAPASMTGDRIFSLLYSQPVTGGGSRAPLVPADTSFYVKYGSMTLRRFSWSVPNGLLNGGNYPITYVNVFVSYSPSLSSWSQLTPGSDGWYSSSRPIYGIQTCMHYVASPIAGPFDKHFYGVNDLPVIFLIDSTTGAVEDQTDEIMSTDGSDSIVGGETSGGEQGLLDRFGFLGQTVGWVGDIFGAFQTTEEQSSLSFPGVQADVWGYQFGIPAFTVDIWQSCPVLEVPCRTFTTIVAVFLWVKGMFAAWTNFLSTGHWGLPEVHVEDDAE